MSVIIGVSGHRPDKLVGGYERYNNAERSSCHLLELSDFFVSVYDIYRPDYIRTGMELGANTAAAYAAIRMGIPLVAHVPYPNFGGSRWTEENFKDLNYLLSNAHQVIYTREVEPESKREKNAIWNQLDTDVAQDVQFMLTLWNYEKKGGTYNCIQYCKSKGIQTLNLWAMYKARFDSEFDNNRNTEQD